MSNAVIYSRVSPQVKAQLRAIADATGLTESQVINSLVRSALGMPSADVATAHKIGDALRVKP